MRVRSAERTPSIAAALVAVLIVAAPAAADFVTFESGQVRPLALSPNGAHLFAVDTPDNRLEIFDVDGSGALTRAASVPVGLEPVAVAARTDGEVWVVNHLSDSVSIVDVASSPPRVLRTLLVGDEPRDIVFAGPGGNRAFITTARRGQNTPLQVTIHTTLTTEGIGRADVWVFDATALGASLGGDPLNIVTLFGDTPRALAVSPDGGTVYAAVFHSGNKTTTLNAAAVQSGGGLPPPTDNFQHTAGPAVGLILQHDGVKWTDELGRNWNTQVKFSLPDFDVFQINANAPTPAETGTPFSGVGTVLFNMAVNPSNGHVYVSNLESKNRVRFEGPGTYANGKKPMGEPNTVRGHLAESRITVLNGGTVTPRPLNKHIVYGTCCADNPTENGHSLAFPLGMAATGSTLYVAGFGSGKIGVYNTGQLEGDTFDANNPTQWAVSGGGPTGVVLNGAGTRLYVLTRFDNSVSVLNTATGAELAHLALFNPEPASVVQGRRFLYDAKLTSSHGDSACASCHIFGDFDSLAWDLGNPDDVVKPNPNPVRVADPIGFSFVGFHPMKGPMTTQSLRGLANAGPMHWRGDRTGGSTGGDPLDESLAFKAFNVAFAGLLGRSGPLTDPEMQAFTDFILQVTYPPNPIRALENTLTTDENTGRTFFMKTQASDVFQPCHGCHALVPASGFFGTDGFTSFEFESQLVKIPHLRNMYQKVGMFGMTAAGTFLNLGNNGDLGPQVRGFGFLHDGSVDTLFRFHNAQVFNQTVVIFGFNVPNPGGFPNGAAGDTLRRQVEQFMHAFDSNLAPIVGQQTTLDDTNAGTVGPRIDLLIQRAAANECEVVVKGAVDGFQRGWYRLPSGMFRSDRAAEPLLDDAALRAEAATPGQPLTYTCVPPGSGERIGVDRNEDGVLDGDQGPVTGGIGQSIRGKRLLVRDPKPGDASRRKLLLLAKESSSANTILGNPVTGGATLSLTLTGDTASAQSFSLPAGTAWRTLGASTFRYTATTGPVASLMLKKNGSVFQLKAFLKGKNGALTLVPPNQGTSALATLAIGGGGTYCTTFGGAAGGSMGANNATTFKVKGSNEVPCP